MTSIRLQGVTKSFGGGLLGRASAARDVSIEGSGVASGLVGSPPLALSDVSLTIRSGEYFVLLGPSGSGKTTLLRGLAGLETFDRGQVWLGEHRVEGWSAARRGLAMLFQEPVLYPQWTVREHLSRGLRGAGLLGWFGGGSRRGRQGDRGLEKAGSSFEGEVGEAHHRSWGVDEVVSLLGLGSLVNRKPYQLSGGERQRVALGRAVLREPAAFLFDEPLSALDSRWRWRLRSDLRRLHRELGVTIVHVTHDQSEAFDVADRVGLLVGGRLRQVGLPGELYAAPQCGSVAGLIGDPPMNLWPAWLREVRGESAGGGPVELGFGGCRWRLSSEAAVRLGLEGPESRLLLKQRLLASGGERAIWMGVRPEALVPVGRGPERGEAEFEAEFEIETVRDHGGRVVVTGRWKGLGSEATGLQGMSAGVGGCSGESFVGRVDPIRWVLSGVGGTVEASRWLRESAGVMRLSWSWDDIHLFDGQSGERLVKVGRS